VRARWGEQLWTFADDSTEYPGSTRVTVVDQTAYTTFTWSRAYVAFRVPNS
jgi:hypothetical protein